MPMDSTVDSIGIKQKVNWPLFPGKSYCLRIGNTVLIKSAG